MRLRNKKTGEIMDDVQYRNYSLSDGFGFRMNGKEWEYHSLAELNEEWEDYKEPKEYYCITGRGNLHFLEDMDDEGDKERKGIGNYFESKEEAEKAVEKLKAWKRLKDKGFRFNKWFTRVLGGLQINVKFDEYCGISPEDKEDLDLLFGGEE